jgi:catechol-2,3-dioxygenase
VEVRELGHVVLYVRDLARSRHFYRDVLGWREVTELGGIGAMFSSGRTHHELLLLEVGRDAAPPPPGRRLGLYHFGLKIGETDDELRDALETLEREGVSIVGTADHTVTHSVYVTDPDGNEIELYIDVQPEVWRDDPAAIVAPPRPLRL